MWKSTIIIPALWLGLFFWGEKRREREREKNNSLLASSLITGYLCNPASSIWNFSTLQTEDDLRFADSRFHRWAAFLPPSKLAQTHSSGGPLMHACWCSVPFVFNLYAAAFLCTSVHCISMPRLLLSLCNTQTRIPMNQSHTRMNGNPKRIRALAHPVSSFDWIVSRLLKSMRVWQECEDGEGSSLLPKQPRFPLHRGGGFFRF